MICRFNDWPEVGSFVGGVSFLSTNFATNLFTQGVDNSVDNLPQFRGVCPLRDVRNIHPFSTTYPQVWVLIHYLSTDLRGLFTA